MPMRDWERVNTVTVLARTCPVITYRTPRDVGLAIDRAGGLLIADDLGDTVWRVTSTP
jgi:glucose/arabinose dehydrogenase